MNKKNLKELLENVFEENNEESFTNINSDISIKKQRNENLL
jgi:hypothetical protein